MSSILWVPYLVQRQVGSDDQRFPAAVPSKPEVIVSVFCDIKCINDDFLKTNFSPRKFAHSASARIHGQRNFFAEHRVWAKPNKCFEAGFVKNQVQNLRGGTGSPCLLRLQTRKFLCRKIIVRFKLNLKTDGPDCKMIFKFGKHVERFHSIRKQCRRIYICSFCVAKHLLENPNPFPICTVPVQARHLSTQCLWF